MNLRTQLSLFFGGLLVLVIGLLVASNYKRFYGAMEASLKEQFSVEPFVQVTELERVLLTEKARALVDRSLIRRGVLRANNIIESEGLAGLEKARSSTEESELYSTYEQMLVVLDRDDQEEGQDLIVLTTSEGAVVAETFNKIANVEDFQVDLKVSTANLAEESFWPSLSIDNARGYLVYPNQELYLFGSAPFRTGQGESFQYQGVAVVGKKIDEEFMRHIVHSEDQGSEAETHAVVVYRDKVVANSPAAEKLGSALKERPSRNDVWSGPDGHRYLVKSKPLLSYYLTERESSFYEELPPAEGVGVVYLLRDMDTVRSQAFSGAQQTLLIGLGALAASLLAVPLIARRFTTPVHRLSEAMSSVGEGALNELEADHISDISELKEAGRSFNQMIVGLKQKRVLEHFVPEGTRKEIEALQGKSTELGGTRWERTIMFSDLRGFTSMSEKMSPNEVMNVLNKYLHVMSRAIRLNGGDINEYIGDAILAVFESPDKAVEASIAMNEELLVLRQDKSIEALADLAQGIGLHTGPLVEGNIGEENRRLKRAVVGDTVNLAARIQDRSREGSYSCIFISQDTKDKLKKDFPLVHFGDEAFKGKAEPVPVWEIKISLEPSATS